MIPWGVIPNLVSLTTLALVSAVRLTLVNGLRPRLVGALLTFVTYSLSLNSFCIILDGGNIIVDDFLENVNLISRRSQIIVENHFQHCFHIYAIVDVMFC